MIIINKLIVVGWSLDHSSINQFYVKERHLGPLAKFTEHYFLQITAQNKKYFYQHFVLNFLYGVRLVDKCICVSLHTCMYLICVIWCFRNLHCSSLLK